MRVRVWVEERVVEGASGLWLQERGRGRVEERRRVFLFLRWRGIGMV